MQHLLCGKLFSKYFTWINSSNPNNKPLGRGYLCPCFTDETPGPENSGGAC